MDRVECKIFGKVQGVFFRDFVKENAAILGITGTVENIGDDSVQIIAEGGKETLGKFIKILKQGSELSIVEEISLKWGQATGEFSDFSILY